MEPLSSKASRAKEARLLWYYRAKKLNPRNHKDMSESTQPTILLCEDDPNLGRLLSDYLKAKGFNTTWAKDGVEGLKEFHRAAFDFVMLDVMMPRKDGFQVAEEIRQESRHLPILFLTARSTNEDTLEGFKVGADDYMTKPFSMEELLVRIQAILRRSEIGRAHV